MDQMCVTKHILVMNTTLARFRDPICYMVYPYATEREDMIMWSILKSQCTQNPSGNPFLIIFLKYEMKIIFVVGVFILDNLIEWTLIPIVCWHTCCGGVTNEHTWTLCKNSLDNQCIFRVQLRKIVQNPHFVPFWTVLDRFWSFLDEILIKVL